MMLSYIIFKNLPGLAGKPARISSELARYSASNLKASFKRKLSLSKLGPLNPFFGKTHSTATRFQISLSKLGTPSAFKRHT